MRELINKYKVWIVAVLFLAIIFSARTCANNAYNHVKGENKALKEQVKKSKDFAVKTEENRVKQKDSIKIETAKKEAVIKDLQEKIKVSEVKVIELKEVGEKTKDRIKNMSYKKVADSLNTIYKTTNAVATETSVDLKKDLPNQVLSSVVDANTYKYMIVEKDNQLFAKDGVLIQKDGQLKDSAVLLLSAEKSLEAQKELNGLQTEFINNLEKENSKLRKKNLFEKVILGSLLAGSIYMATK